MARLSLEHLRSPQPAYRIERLPPPPPDRLGRVRGAFESVSRTAHEDVVRSRSLECADDAVGLFTARSAHKLSRKLRRRRVPRTLASSRWMRRVRRRVIGALWKLIAEGSWESADGAQVATFTLIPRAWEFDALGLLAADPRLMMAWLRTELNRGGAGEADGWLIAFIHGEWEPNSGVFRLHVHGVGAGGMLAVTDSLRLRPHFVAPEPDQPPDVVEHRVVLSRKPLKHLPYALSYLLKSYWPERWIGAVDDRGTVKRVRRGRRIGEPHHTQVLLWLDQWRPSDISLLMKIHVGKQGFVPTARRLNLED